MLAHSNRKEINLKTQDLINILVADRTAISPKPKYAIALALAVGAIASASVFLPLAGIRIDLAEAAFSLRFLAKVTIDLLLAASAIGLILRLSRPDTVPGLWSWALGAVPLILAMSVGAELIASPASQWRAQLFGVNWLACLSLIPMFSIAPLVGLFVALKYAAPVNPGLVGAIAGVAAGGVAAVIYAAHCPDDSPLFVAAWYTLAIGLVALLGYFAGKRWLWW
jgi:hypothetical protein